ncbi:MAG: hypothetical protein KAR84_00155 [Elusimicrobiales bacterium]|nr:hypothetical protein [Elusimicrobiales bacterium]
MENERILIIQFQLTRFKVLALLTALFICFHPKLLGSEQLTLTTYYPSPYGGYAKLLTTDQTVLARDGGAVGVGGYNTVTGASTKLAVKGNVGIGTSAPKNKLDIGGGAVIGAAYSAIDTAPSNGLLIQGNVGIGTTAPKNKLDIGGGAVIGAAYSGTKTASSNGLLVQGNVGIGRSPSYPLDIKGDVRITSLNFSSPGILRGLCTARRYRENRPSRCRFGEKIIGYYGDGNVQVYGFLAADGSMSGTGTYITMGQDWNGTMICCKIEID